MVHLNINCYDKYSYYMGASIHCKKNYFDVCHNIRIIT